MTRRLQTVAAVTCMKLMLLVFNVVFWAAGIILLAFGLWMKISLHNLMELSDAYNETIPYVFIGTGALIVMAGFFACCCTVKGQSVLLYMLAIFLSVVLVLEIVAGVTSYIYRDRIRQGFETGLNKSISHYGHGGIRDKDIDLLQSYLKCCGVNSYIDWYSKWNNGSVPLSCCRDKSHCHNAPLEDEAEIYTSGCYSNIVDFVNHNLGIIFGGALVLSVFQIFGICLAGCLGKYIEKAKYEPVA
ncbi:tetraspanin-7-like [Uloborus diversus]|uniref:tetraspanin-7-like n=1 Tax=Uloborus diversus TaxID=327109 RepID=UPI0024095257|nr:tetraspanin-7-like [Uloborus diversus]